MSTKSALTPAEAFEKLSISRSLGYAMIKDGRLRAVHVTPRKIVLPVAELERFLQERQTKTDAA